MVKSADCTSKGPEFNPQQPHGGPGPSIKGSDALLWSAGIHADRALIYQNNIKTVNLKTRLSVLKTNLYERLGVTRFITITFIKGDGSLYVCGCGYGCG